MTKKEGSICSHQPDADEPRDQVELGGFAPMNETIAAEPTECRGFTCSSSSATCDVCKFSDCTNKDDIEGSESPGPQSALPESPRPSYLTMNHLVGRKGSLEDLYSVASNIQGARATAEGRRMKNFCV